MDNDWRLYLAHHGIKGQHWGIRRYQNADGTLTTAGQKRYGEKVTMHNGKNSLLFGKRKYQTHQEYVTANKFAKGTYKQNKARIKEEKEKALEKADTFGKKMGARLNAMAKNRDNREQYSYELARNRVNAGVHETARETVKGAAKRGALAATVVGAGVVAGMLHANYLNNRAKKESAGRLPINGMENYYEYKIGKKEVAKYLGKAVALGSLYGLSEAMYKNGNAQAKVDRYDTNDSLNKTKNTRSKRAAEDEARWKKGKV